MRTFTRQYVTRAALAAALCLLATASSTVVASGLVGSRPNWRTEVPLPARYFDASDRAIAVDGDGDPHVAYGGQELIYAERSGAVWTIEVADTTLGAGVGADLELDAAGNAHIAHFDRPNDRILYTTNAGGSWTTSVVDTVGPDADLAFNSVDSGELALALDGGADAHIAYYNAELGELRYATNATDTWVVESLDDEGSGARCDIAVDASGNAHVAYTKEGRVRDDVPEFRSVTLRYATNASGSWKDELVDAGARVADLVQGAGEGCSIALDSGGNAHMAYRDNDAPAPGGAAIHTTNASGQWVRTVLGGQTIFSGGTTGIAVDGSDVVHATFSEAGGVGYASNAGGSFTSEIAVPGGSGNALAVTAGGTVHLAHFAGAQLAVTSGTAGSFTTDPFDAAEFAFGQPHIDTDPAGNAYYTHATAAGLLLTDDSGGSWQSDLIDADATGGRAHLVIDGAGDAHVVYERRPISTRELVYANNSGGSWARTVLDTSANSLGDATLAVDGSGDVHVVYGDPATNDVRYATNRSGSFVNQLVQALNPFETVNLRDVAVDSGGFAHTAYGRFDTAEVVYATNASGSWVTEALPTDGILTPFVTIALDSADVPHMAYEFTTDPVTFYGRIFYGTRGPSGWDIDLVIPSPAFVPVIEIDVNDDVHMAWDAGTFLDADVGYATNQGGSWQYGVFDRGGLGARAFPEPTFTVREGDTAALIPIAPSGRIDVAGPDLAVHTDCTVHMVYSDVTLQNLKYAVQTATVPSPVASVSFATSNGTASAGSDYTATNLTVQWAAGDTGARFAVVPLVDDGDLEGNETVRLTLSNPTGDAILGFPSTATLIIEDDDAAPPDATVSYVLPKNVKVKLNEKNPEKSLIVAAGFFDTGTGAVDLTGPARLTVGGLMVSVPALETKGKGFRLAARGVDFTITPNRAGSSRAKFKLKMKRRLADLVDPDSPIRIRFQAGSVDGTGEVLLTNGRYRLGKAKGTLVAPTLFTFQAKAKLKGGGGDALTIQAGLGTLGDTPVTAPQVRIAFGPAFEQTITPGEFTRKGDKYVFKGASGGLTSVTLDYGKEKLTAKGKGLGLGDFIDGAQPVLVSTEIADLRNVAVRMVKKGTALKY